MSKAAHFALVTAFTTNVYAGNPAAIVFLDPHLPLDVLGKIAGNFNQPITSIVSSTSDTSDNDKTITRHIRYVVSNGKEVAICGHGTLAAAKVLFTQLGPGQENVDTIHFRCILGARLVAIKREDGFIEIEFPSGVPVNVNSEVETRLTLSVNKAFGREVLIKSIICGPGVYRNYLIVEVDEKENLGASDIDPRALADTGYDVNVFTSSATNTDALFVSRMFAPLLLESEDAACGTSHCLLTPYWCEKHGISPGQEVSAKQVSARGGNIRAIWDDVNGTVKLRGQAAIFATGQFQSGILPDT